MNPLIDGGDGFIDNDYTHPADKNFISDDITDIGKSETIDTNEGDQNVVSSN
jgi:hypothetical protein